MKSALKSPNIFKGLKESIHSEESLCKGELLLKDVCVNQPGQTSDRWFPLGSGDWSNDDGPVCATRGLAAPRHASARSQST